MSFPGLRADCETLLSRFQETDSVRFEEFSAIWKELKFSSIFYGGMRSMESNMFTREAFSFTSLYFLPPYTFQIRVGALYLLYGLYNTQLCQPKQKIRIALKDWSEVDTFHQDLISAQHLDAAYIFTQMRLNRAFHFTGMPALLTFKQRNLGQNVGKEEFKEVRDRVADLVTSETLEEMLNIHEHYQKTKCLISADKSQPDKALSLIKKEFVSDLKNLVTEHQLWKHEKNKPRTKTDEDKEGASQESEGTERAIALANIKSKSYSSVVKASKFRRHRQVHMDSSESGSDKGRKKAQKGRRNRRKNTGKKGALDLKGDKAAARRKSSSQLAAITEEDTSSSSEEMPKPKRKRAR
ncbi:hypothetical protein FKM82_016991 [Ascaphus truei]